MFIRAYLRASTEDQNAERAKTMLNEFVAERQQRIANFYIENVSSTKLQRNELERLINESQEGDVLLVEQIDRLTRLTDKDWKQLKSKIEHSGLRVVSLDVPTSWMALDTQKTINDDPIIKAVLDAINTMLIDLMAAMARKDYETRREHQAQGIQRAIKLGKYKGKQADYERHKKVMQYREKGYSIAEIAKLTEYGTAQVCRIIKKHNLIGM